MSCPHCPHCIASGAYGLIDANDPALTTNQPKAPRRPRLARTPGTIAALCHKCRAGEMVFRGAKEWVHGNAGARERCEASDMRDAHYGKVPYGHSPNRRTPA